MTQHPIYVIVYQTEYGVWNKLDQLRFSTHVQASNWLLFQLEDEFLPDDNTYYVCKKMSATEFKARYYTENGHGNGKGNKM